MEWNACQDLGQSHEVWGTGRQLLMLKSNSWYITEWIVCSRGPCERHRQEVSITVVCFGLFWDEASCVSLRFHVFRRRLGSIWFHHVTSILNPFDIFWHYFTQVDGLWMVLTFGWSFFIVIVLIFPTFRLGGAGLGFPTHSWHWLLTPQKSYGLRRNTVLINLRLSWKGQYDFGFQALL